MTVARAILADLAADPEALAELRRLVGGADGELLTAAEVGERLKVDRRTVNRWATEGRVPAVRVGGAWRFQMEDVLRRPRRTPPEPIGPAKPGRRRTPLSPQAEAAVRAIRGE